MPSTYADAMPTLRISRLLVALRTALPILALALPTATAQPFPDTAYVDVISLRALGTVTQQAGMWTLRVGSRTIAWTEDRLRSCEASECGEALPPRICMLVIQANCGARFMVRRLTRPATQPQNRPCRRVSFR